MGLSVPKKNWIFGQKRVTTTLVFENHHTYSNNLLIKVADTCPEQVCEKKSGENRTWISPGGDIPRQVGPYTRSDPETPKQRFLSYWDVRFEFFHQITRGYYHDAHLTGVIFTVLINTLGGALSRG